MIAYFETAESPFIAELDFCPASFSGGSLLELVLVGIPFTWAIFPLTSPSVVFVKKRYVPWLSLSPFQIASYVCVEGSNVIGTVAIRCPSTFMMYPSCATFASLLNRMR